MAPLGKEHVQKAKEVRDYFSDRKRFYSGMKKVHGKKIEGIGDIHVEIGDGISTCELCGKLGPYGGIDVMDGFNSANLRVKQIHILEDHFDEFVEDPEKFFRDPEKEIDRWHKIMKHLKGEE